MVNKLCSILVLCLLLSFQVQGQNDHVYWNYDISHGLPTNSIYHVFVDSKDRVWFGSDKGVTKYDGNKFTTYTIKDGLPDNTVIRCYEDSRGKIWFHHIDQLPSYYLNGEITRLDEKNDQFAVESMSNLIELDNKIIFGGVGGFIAIDSNDNSTVYQTETGWRNITLYLENKNLYYWSMSKTDLSYSEIFPQVQKTNLNNTNNQLVNCSNHKIPVESISRSRGLVKKFNSGEITLKHLLTIESEAGKIYNIEFLGSRIIVASVKGLFEFKNIGNEIQLISTLIANTPIAGVTFDSENNIWANSIKSGLFFISNKKSNFFPNPNANRLLKIKSIESEILVFGESEFFYQLTKKELKVKNSRYNRTRAGRLIADYYKSERYEIVIADCLYISDFVTSKTYFPATRTSITTIFNNPENENEFYFAGNVGMNKVILGDTFLVEGDLFKELGRIKQVTFYKGKLMLGTQHGLFVGNNGKPYPYKEKIVGDSRINSLFRLKDRLLIGTSDKGLFLDNYGHILSLDESAGLLSNTVRGIYKSEDENCVWVHSDIGIQKYEVTNEGLKEKLKIDIRTHYKIDEISDMLEHNGELILVLNSGVRTIPIKNFQMEKSISAFLESINVGKLKYNTKTADHFSSKEKNLKFQISAVNHSAHPIRYFYRINNGNWIENETDQFTFSSLSPDNYTFEFKVSSPFYKTAYIAPINLSIEKEWYQKTYIIIIAFLLSILIISLYIRLRILKTQNKKRRILSNELMALQSQMNPHFTFNSLNSIQSYLSTNDKRSAQIYLADFAILMRKILDQAKLSLVPIVDEIDFLKQYLDLEKRRLNDSFTYEVEIDESIDQQRIKVPTLMLQPFVENAIWHGVAPIDYPGEIRISFQLRDGNLFCQITDNGQGLNTKKKNKPYHKSTGIINCKERMSLFKELHGKEMKLEIIDNKQNNSKGLTVLLIIPTITLKN